MQPLRYDLADNYTHLYGPDGDRLGIASDHVGAALNAGGQEYVLASGRQIVIFPDGSWAPVLCGSVIPVWSEDGPATGRCGLPVVGGEGYACSGHTAERQAWDDMSDPERVQWERELDAQPRSRWELAYFGG